MPASLSRGTERSTTCITCPTARKRALNTLNQPLSYKEIVITLFSLRSMLEAKAFLLSPAELGVVISLKHTRQRAVLTHGPFFASVCTRLCQYVIWGFGNGLKKRRKTKTQVAQNPESIEPQGFPGCIFFGNKRHGECSYSI